MAGGIAGCFMLGILFLSLAVRQYRQITCWRGAVRLLAVVKSVQYREAWQGKTEINDHKSSGEAVLYFTDQGKIYEKHRQYTGILNAPVQGQKLPILFRRDSGDWILRKEVRTHWRLFLVLGCICFAGGLALLMDGHGILSDLAEYHVEAPNLAGSVVCALVGVTTGCCAYACIRGIMPGLIRTAAEPFVWMVKFYLLHRYEEADALCIGIIRRESGDDDVSYYPFFQYSVEGKLLHWLPRRQMSRKRYQPGSRYILYRDFETGRCALKPTGWDLASALLSFIPIGFFAVFILSLAVCSVGTLFIAGVGFLSAFS